MACRRAPAVLRQFCGLRNRQIPRSLPSSAAGGNKLRHFLSRAADLSADVEQKLASGIKMDKSSTTYALVVSEIDRLRWANDKIIAQVAALKDIRKGFIAEKGAKHQGMLNGDVNTHGPALIDVLSKIEDVESQIAGCRSQQLQNSKDIGVLKRGKVRIEKNAEVKTLVQKVDDALKDGHALTQKKPLMEALSALLERLQKEFDDNSQAALTIKLDVENSVSKLRSLVLARRVRRGRIDVETELLGGVLISSFYELLRKNSKLSRVRDVQLLDSMDINLLEKAVDRLDRHAKVQEVIDSGDREKMEEEVRALLEETGKVTRALADVETSWIGHSNNATETIQKLRDPQSKDIVTTATGQMREELFKALREEELCSVRMASLRRSEARNLTLICRLRATLQQ